MRVLFAIVLAATSPQVTLADALRDLGRIRESLLDRARIARGRPTHELLEKIEDGTKAVGEGQLTCMRVEAERLSSQPETASAVADAAASLCGAWRQEAIEWYKLTGAAFGTPVDPRMAEQAIQGIEGDFRRFVAALVMKHRADGVRK